MNRGQASAKKKRPRRSTPKKGAARLTPARKKFHEDVARDIALTPPEDFPTDDTFMRL